MSSSINMEPGYDEARNRRQMQAQDPRTSPYTLKNLSKDPDWVVRSCVATNPGTPEGVLWELSYDNDLRVRASAFERLDALGLRVGHKAPVLVQNRAVEQADPAVREHKNDSLISSKEPLQQNASGISEKKASLDKQIASASMKAGNTVRKYCISKDFAR